MFVIRKHLRPTSFISPLAKYLDKSAATVFVKHVSTTQPNNGKEEEGEAIEQNPFYEKYKQKIAKVKEETEVQQKPSTSRFNKYLRQETQEWKRNIEGLEKKFTDKKSQEEGRISGLKLPANLDQLIKMELLVDKSADEISKLWTEYWAGKDTVCAVINQDIFYSMSQRMKESPMFLYPLPRDQGYEFYLAQFTDMHCFYTSLINFQVHGEEAPWQVCFKFYPELKDSKGIVLMTSEFDNSQLNILEVQYLAQLQQLFYASPTEERAELMRTFNHQPDNFKHMDVVKEIESGDFIIRKKE